MSELPNGPSSDTSKLGTLAGNQDSPPNLFAATPVDTRESVNPSTIVPGAEVGGRYRLGEEIARGGMGIVLRANDTTLGREVAVKVLSDRYEPDSGAARRFAKEARITGRLQHPGIPPVHDVGTLPDGRPFLAMKLIKGRTLADLLRERPDPSHDRGQFVAIFEQICQAVGYAHAHGVVHRDLKPHNVMVGRFGEVQVMDWGLAKVLTDARTVELGPGDSTLGTEIRSMRDTGEETEAGTVLGTPNYMPPEQATGAVDQVDERSDVFCLGGVLCTILTGLPPYSGADPEATRQRAARARLEDALGRLAACGAEPGLVALCERCLAPEKADRPADGKAVADEVAAHRAGVAERARRADEERAVAAAEAREQRKRRRVQLSLAGAVGLILLGGGAFAWWNQKTRANQARIEGDILRAEAEAQRQQQAVRDRITAARTAGSTLLEQTERALGEINAEQAEGSLAEAVRRVDEGGIDEFRPRVGRCAAELETLKKLDAIDDEAWVVVDGKLPPVERVVSRWKEVFAGYGIAPGVTPPGEVAAKINGSLIRERLLISLEEWFVVGGRDPNLRAILSTVDPDEFRDDARMTNYQRAILSRAFRGKSLTAQPVWFAIAHGQDKRIDPGPREQLLLATHTSKPNSFVLLIVLGGLRATAESVRDLAPWHRSAGWYRAALAVRPRNVVAWCNLGITLYHSGDLSSAIAAYKEAIQHDRQYAKAHSGLGLALQESGDLPGAIAAHREATRLDPNSANAHYNLGVALAAARVLPGAVAAFKESIRLDPTDAKVQYNLGKALGETRDRPGAIAAYKEAIRLDPNYVHAHNNLGAILRASGDPTSAIAAYREAIRLDPKHVNAHTGLGNALLDAGDLPGAIEAHREAIRLDPSYATAHYNLGIALVAASDRPGAIAAYREAIRLDPSYANAYINLGGALQASGDLPGAIAAYRELIRLDPNSAMGHHNLGFALRASGDLPGAIAACKEAIRLDPKNPRCHSNLGAAHLDQKQYPEAMACAREAIKCDPTFSTAHAILGNALWQTGDIPAARAALTEAARLDPRWKPHLAKLPPVPVAPPPRPVPPKP
jgi:tetratricopeptide (TPR) repeat protein